MTDYQLGDTIYHKFTTRAFATGIPTTLAGSPVVSVYEDDSLTQITAGVTLTVDFDSVTGLNHLTVVATGGNGFETGKFYSAVITTGTVGGVSVVGETVWSFSLEASAAALDLANGTDGLGAIKTDTAAVLVDTADMQPKLGTPAGADISADIAAIEAQTDDIGAAGAGLTAIPWNPAWDAEVQSEATDALNAYDPPTRAELTSDIASLPTAAENADAVWDEAMSGHIAVGTFGQLGAAWTSGQVSDGSPLAGDFDSDLSEASDDHFNNHGIIFTSGALAGQMTRISDYTGSSKNIVLEPDFSEAPANGDDFLITPWKLPIITGDGMAHADTREVSGTAQTAGDLAALVTAVDAVVDAVLVDTDTTIPGLIAALNDLSAADVNTQVDAAFTTQMADSVPADGTIPTREQAIYMIAQFLFERVVSGTDVSVKKVDGSTELFGLVTDSASAPTTISRDA